MDPTGFQKSSFPIVNNFLQIPLPEDGDQVEQAIQSACVPLLQSLELITEQVSLKADDPKQRNELLGRLYEVVNQDKIEDNAAARLCSTIRKIVNRGDFYATGLGLLRNINLMQGHVQNILKGAKEIGELSQLYVAISELENFFIAENARLMQFTMQQGNSAPLKAGLEKEKAISIESSTSNDLRHQEFDTILERFDKTINAIADWIAGVNTIKDEVNGMTVALRELNDELPLAMSEGKENKEYWDSVIDNASKIFVVITGAMFDERFNFPVVNRSFSSVLQELAMLQEHVARIKEGNFEISKKAFDLIDNLEKVYSYMVQLIENQETLDDLLSLFKQFDFKRLKMIDECLSSLSTINVLQSEDLHSIWTGFNDAVMVLKEACESNHGVDEELIQVHEAVRTFRSQAEAYTGFFGRIMDKVEDFDAKIVGTHQKNERTPKVTIDARMGIEGSLDQMRQKRKLFFQRNKRAVLDALKDSEFCHPELAEKISQSEELLDLLCQDLAVHIDESNPALPPMGIPNTGNACYRSAANQLLIMAIPLLGEDFLIPLSRRAQLFKDPNADLEEICRRLTVLNTLKLYFTVYHRLQSSSDTDRNHCEQLLYFQDLLLLDALLKSKCMPDLNDNTKHRQQDAMGYFEAVLGDVLKKKFRVTRVRSTIDDVGKEIKREKVESDSLIKLYIQQHLDSMGSTPLVLQQILDSNFQVEVENKPEDPWKVELEDGTEKSFALYNQQELIVDEPEVFFLQSVRSGVKFTGGNIEPVFLDAPLFPPKNLVVDLSSAYNKPSGTVLYKIAGFIHYRFDRWDSLGNAVGHYTAYKEGKNGEGTAQWYKMDDATVTTVSDENVFEQLKMAYTIMLCKIAPERTLDVAMESIEDEEQTEHNLWAVGLVPGYTGS